MGLVRRRRLITLAVVVALVSAIPAAMAAAPPPPVFTAGAAQVDITPPPWSAAADAAEFVPACGASPAQVAASWPGARGFAFEKPYIDLFKLGRWAPGDPYCDADHTLRYEAPYVAGGSGQNRWPESVDRNNPVSAQAVVVALGNQREAIVSVDSIGLFNVTMDQIRAAVSARDPGIADVFVSSTHDESAPDPIGLWGPDLSDVPGSVSTPAAISSGVDEAYMQFLASRVADAVVQADTSVGGRGPLGVAVSGRQPVVLRMATARQPANSLSCWSSYPYIESTLFPVMQGVNATSHKVVFTLVNGQTHVETLAFSGVPAYTHRFTADWPGEMRAALEASAPGSVAMEMTGLVGSVETPTVYLPASTTVSAVPGPIHSVSGNPDGCDSVYTPPKGATPVKDAEAFVTVYGDSVAGAATTALQHATTVSPTTLRAERAGICVQLENNLFLAAFAARLIPDRPAFADAGCSVGLALNGQLTSAPATAPAVAHTPVPTYLRTEVATLMIGPAVIAYSPGEVFPFTEIGGPIDAATMPFPTNCYNPITSDFGCGPALPMTPNVAADMPGSFRFMAGLGEDMIGYLFPPGNFVGSQGETLEPPWVTYETATGSDHDRFGHGHADDAESVGPWAGLAMTQALDALLVPQLGSRPTVVPGLFVDGQGRFSLSPFASHGFSGAVGIETVDPDGTRHVLRGPWATYLSTPDAGTAGTALPYSVATRGVFVGGKAVLVDTFSGARALGF